MGDGSLGEETYFRAKSSKEKTMNTQHSVEKQQIGVVLVNLGTPTAPTVKAVRTYLREFLSDPDVIDLWAPLRWMLLYGLILPFRPRRIAPAYAAIWQEGGSPLAVASEALTEAVGEALGDDFKVVLGMRYGKPSLWQALDTLKQADVKQIWLWPMFPQFANATTGSIIKHAHAWVQAQAASPALAIAPPFCDAPPFIEAWRTVAAPILADFAPEHLLMSFHGLPQKQVKAVHPSHCLASATCCDTLGPANRHCYRAQCMATARALQDALHWPKERCSVAFQSRLGPVAWIPPYLEDEMQRLAKKGVKRLALVSPAFVADCLETLEELGIRAEESWKELGGDELRVLPCLNAHPTWVNGLVGMIQNQAQAPQQACNG